jgi:hypothetical protein
MAYPSHVASRDEAARSGTLSRTLLAGGALATMVAGLGYGLSPYVDFGAATGGAAIPAAPAPQAAAPTLASPPGLFEPRLSLGVGAGFVAPQRMASPAVAPATPVAPSPHVARGASGKPTPLPEPTEAEADLPTPPARPAEVAAAPQGAAEAAASQDVASQEAAPEPPRRPGDLAPLASVSRPSLAARTAPPAVSFAAPAQRMARVAPAAPRGERTDHLERLYPGDAPVAAGPAATARARILSRRSRSVLARAAAPEPSFFQKLFGGAAQPAGALAYAPTGRLVDDVRATGSIAPSARREVASLGPDYSSRPGPAVSAPSLGGGRAIYDISAQVVIMPDGTRLEAHSGLGQHRDDPRSQRLRMRGVTPPGVYHLREREALFHGVRAIRMTPVGGSGAIHGRNGILAHTYMLGPNGDSNGCVSFRNYNAFLNAFLDGKVSQLVVVESMSGLNRFALR